MTDRLPCVDLCAPLASLEAEIALVRAEFHQHSKLLVTLHGMLVDMGARLDVLVVELARLERHP